MPTVANPNRVRVTRPRTEEDWRTQAACRSVDPEMFYVGINTDPKPALRVCAHCPALEECRQAADRNEGAYLWGIIGGETPTQRASRRRKIRASQKTLAKGPIICGICHQNFEEQE